MDGKRMGRGTTRTASLLAILLAMGCTQLTDFDGYEHDVDAGADAAHGDAATTDAAVDAAVDGGVDAATADAGTDAGAPDGGTDASENHPPSFSTVPPDETVEPCVPLTVELEAMDPDGDDITYSSPDLPAGATLTRVGATVVLDWTPTSSQAGMHSITIVATDDGTPSREAMHTYDVEVASPPAMAIDPITDVVVTGGELAVIPVLATSHACYSLSATDLPSGATFDAGTGELQWTTTPDDFGIYDVTFTLRDDGDPPAEATRPGRIVVQYRDDFTAWAGYTEREVYYPTCCDGPADWTATTDTGAEDGAVCLSHSDGIVDVVDHAHRVLDRSAVPFGAVDYEIVGRDEVVGTACGSGGLVQLLDFAVTDPAATWPDWSTSPTPFLQEPIPDGTYGTVAGTAVLPSPGTDLTLVALHSDQSNGCTVDVYWDRILLTPVEDAPNRPPTFTSIPAAGATQPCVPFSASFEATDPDGDSVSYASPDLPAGATLTTVGSTAVLDWTPTSAQDGSHTITLQATDDGTPPETETITYTVDVAAAPPMTIDAIADVTVVGGATATLAPVAPTHACYTLTATDLPTGATWDASTRQVQWTTVPDDFGIYDVTFTLSDTSTSATTSGVGRILVQYRDDFASWAGYTEHEVYYPTCCSGPVTWTAESDGSAEDGQVVHSHTDGGVDVKGLAHRVFDRSAVPLSAVDYAILGRDVVVGPACGSGGLVQLLDIAVTDPAATWPDWSTGPSAFLQEPVPDGTYGAVTGTASLPSAGTDVTLVVHHSDQSNACVVDVYWDRILLTPVP